MSTSTFRSTQRAARRGCELACVLWLLAGCASVQRPPVLPASVQSDEQLLIVDCLMPGQVRKLGAFSTGVSPRRPEKVPAYECELAGGEYALASRDPKRALAIWLPFAQRGDALAQTQVGELYERGVGSVADYATAAAWYQKAADQNEARAIIDLASLYERGLGVKRDAQEAARLFRQASGQVSAPSRLAIHIIDPVVVLPTANGDGTTPSVRLAGQGTQRQLTGKVTAEAGLRQLTLNDKPLAFDAQGVFRATLDLSQGPMELRLVATDRQGNQSMVSFSAVAGTASPARNTSLLPDHGVASGAYRALVIANQNYQHWERLDTPLRDAQDLKQLLERRYGFKVTLLADATRREMFTALNALRAQLGSDDNLLVFYAGHGDIDPVTQRGYWVPVDGERHNRSNWMSVLDVTDQLNALPARQVLVVADSCYSGTMARTALAAADADLGAGRRWDALRAMGRLRARVALTSGGLEPVVDGGAGRNSLFTRSLIDVLSAVNEPIEGRRVHEELAARFSLRAQRLKLQQKPEYAPIRFAGHEAGDFLFVPQR
ncbi:MAG: caspase family protein [Rhizobacter sp.]